MATITYSGSGKTLSGTAQTDQYIVDSALLGDRTLRLKDGGGDNTLVVQGTVAAFDRGSLRMTGDGILWQTEQGGGILFSGGASASARIVRMEWRTPDDTPGAPPDGTTLVEQLWITAEPTPPAGHDIALVGSRSDDDIALAGTGIGAVPGISVIWADRGDDSVLASADQATLVYGGKGNDVIRTPGPAQGMFHGGGGRDILVGCSGEDLLWGGGGGDILQGNDGDDLLRGKGGNDTLIGGNGADMLAGGGKADRLQGGDGNDRLTGGPGADVFVFSTQQENDSDIIRDFRPARDRIAMAGTEFAELDIAGANGGADTLIRFGNGNTILLEDTHVSAVDRDCFEFL